MHLQARPQRVPQSSLRPGTLRLELSNGRPGLLHVPEGEVVGLVVALHGAGGNAQHGLDLLRSDAEKLRLVVLAPASAGSTWASVWQRGLDADSAALNDALHETFALHPFKPENVAVAGFSDGASYALTLGLANGDLFGRVVAFSPGFENADRRQGKPQFFVTHGVSDQVLPIDRTSRRLVPRLRSAGYEVTYEEFQGGHVVPPRYSDQGARWILETRAG